MTYKKIFLLFVTMATSQWAISSGIDTYYNDLSGEQVRAGGSFTVKDDRFMNRSWQEIEKTYYVNNFVAFEINDYAKLIIKEKISCTISIRIDKWNERNDSSGVYQRFTIEYDPAEGAEYPNRQIYYFNDAHKFKVTVLDIQYNENGKNSEAIPSLFRIKGQTDISRLLTFSCTYVTDITHAYQSTTDRLRLSWSLISGAEEYDLEWTYYDTYSDLITRINSISFNTPNTYNAIFQGNATRITTKLTSFELPLVYPSGYIFYRIRGAIIGTNGLRQVSKWSSEIPGTLLAFSDKYQIPTSHENLLNWQTQTVFAEDGKNSQSVSYFDGTSRSRQEVSLSRADSMVIIGETIYDHQGRPSAQVMPSPNNSYPEKIEYYPYFARNNSAAPYSKLDFDLNGSTCDSFVVNPMSTSYGASWYYSGSNTKSAQSFHKFIPDAEQYPFSVTEYTPDLTGRIKRQGEVGKILKINAGRATRYYYAKPSQDELTRLFGSDVGKAEHYQKNMVKDPNGQISVSYIDAHGRTIATALAGDSPTNVQSLSIQSGQGSSSLTRQLLNNVTKDASLVSTYSLPVTNAGNYTFTYSVSDTAYREACMNGNICYDCLYDLKISISDDCEVTNSFDTILTNVQFSNPFDTLCSTPATGINATFVKMLQPGVYQVTKTLRVSQDAVANYANQFIKQSGCIPKSEAQILDEFKQEIDFNCIMSCDSCKVKLNQMGTRQQFLTSFITAITQGGGVPNAQDTLRAYSIYDEVKAECNSICEDSPTRCESYYHMLLADVSLGGQYANIIQTSDTDCTWNNDTTSIFYLKYKTPTTPYVDETGKKDTVFIDGLPFLPQDLTICDFRNYWKPSWAKSLVKYHPEYCLYQTCVALSASNTFDSLVWAKKYYDAAFIDSLNQVLNDPFFQSGGPGAGYLTPMLEFLTSSATYACYSYPISDVIISFIACDGVLPCSTSLESLCTSDQNLYWQIFRSVYIGKKYAFWSNYIANSPSCPNSKFNCIAAPTCAQYPSNNPYATKVKRWIVYDPVPAGSDPNEILVDQINQANAGIQESCTTNCEITVNDWFRQLKASGCVNITTNDSIAMRTRFMAVCMRGCDATHPYGATNTPPGTDAGNPPHFDKDIKQVITSVLGSVTACADTVCNGILISFPGAYEAPQSAGGGRPIIMDPEPCVCANITKFETCFNQGATGFATITDYINSFSDVKMTKADLDSLKVYCANECNAMNASVTLPPQLDCNICKTCDQINALKTEFDQTFCTVYGSGTNTYNKMLTAFLNRKSGFKLNWADYNTFFGKCNKGGITAQCKTALSLCPRSSLPPMTLDTACYAAQLQIAQEAAHEAYLAQLGQIKKEFEARYLAACLAPLESFTASGNFNEYHYTLYFYDQAGNLVKTVPPAGVNLSTNPATYSLATTYQYDCFNNIVHMTTPDGGVTQYWYDKLGRLVISKSARQVLPERYSYTKYDGLGRVIEVGEKELGSGQPAMSNTIAKDSATLAAWIDFAPSTLRKDVTHTYYDATPYSIPPFTTPNQAASNLRKRVAVTTIETLDDGNPTTHTLATHYSYDISGNIKTCVQDIPFLIAYSHQYNRMDYEYDLISGKVNTFYFQKGALDQFIHKYTYDENNRVVNVKTGVDGVTWDNDADYSYFHHGPLARTVIGERKVQGIDYAYTLHGWLKGVNASAIDSSADMGRDAYIASSTGVNTTVAQDAFGFTLGYFQNDYKKISNSSTPDFEMSKNYGGFYTATPNLYNGNIRHIACQERRLTPAGYVYLYDQLNRIKEMDAWFKPTSTWAASGAFRERITYDPNGNIQTYIRRGGGGLPLPMDSLTYAYYANSNRLRRVNDNTGYSANYPDDIDNQTTTDNYLYDASGNMRYDAQSGTAVSWTAYGKPKGLTMPGQGVNFFYDAQQNRVLKRITTAGITTSTYYIRDAQGNILATYEQRLGTMKLRELNLFGSSRLGIFRPEFTVYPVPGSGISTTYAGKKNYELTNHLGNVLAVVSDNRTGVDTGDPDALPNYYVPDMIASNEYYPFGMNMPGNRSFVLGGSTAYRYGFNDKEKDPKTDWANQSHYDYGFRIYNPAIGRFLSVDPISAQYPWYTPYQFAGNKPIRYIDRDGAEEDDPDLFYKNSLPVIANNANQSALRTTSPELYEERMAMLGSALQIAQDNEDDGYFLGARAMRRYLEGYGGYDVYSYNSMVGNENFDNTVNSIHNQIRREVFQRVNKLGAGTHQFTIDVQSNYKQGGTPEEFYEDFWWAFGNFNIMASAEINVTIQDGEDPVISGKLNYKFRDNYVWDVNRIIYYNVYREVAGMPSHPELASLRDLGANFYSIRASFSENISTFNNSWFDRLLGKGKQSLLFSGGTDSPSSISEPNDRYKLIDSRGIIYSFNKYLNGTRENKPR